MNVLVIGASSFVGAYQVEKNGKKYHFSGGVGTGRNQRFKDYYDSIGVPYHYVDICDLSSFDILNQYHFDAAVLFATYMPSNVPKISDDDDTSEYYKINVLGTLNVLEYCRKHGINKLI